jgi:hypothetical protein
VGTIVFSTGFKSPADDAKEFPVWFALFDETATCGQQVKRPVRSQDGTIFVRKVGNDAGGRK